jgi:hypothetical protein
MPETRDWALIRRFTAPHANFPRLISQVKREPELLDALLMAVSSDVARVKFGAAKALRNLSGRAPDLLYPHFDFFASFLRNENSILRWNAILIVGNLAAVDEERRVDRIIDGYLSTFSGPHMIDAGNTMRGAAAMGVAKPYLADMIARRILEVERATYATPECRNVAIGHAIESLDHLFPIIADRRAVQRFVSRQMDNTRTATRKKAEGFLRKWPFAPSGVKDGAAPGGGRGCRHEHAVPA